MNLQDVHASEDETVIKLCISQGYGAEWIPNHRDLSDRVKELSEIDNEPRCLFLVKTQWMEGFSLLFRISSTDQVRRTRGRDGPGRCCHSEERERTDLDFDISFAFKLLQLR